MAAFSPELAEIRFGCGLSPRIGATGSVADMLDRLAAPDHIAQRFPVPALGDLREEIAALAKLQRDRRKAQGAAKEEATRQLREASRKLRGEYETWMKHSILRWVNTDQALRERLALFWADHFTAYGKAALLRFAAPAYIEGALRPNLTGSFADLLFAAVTHPVMLHYLDQARSFGPNSRAANRARRPRGLNENLAREVLELHTLGVDGPYDQNDVRQLAELFTGLSFGAEQGFLFRPALSEPGTHTVLGRRYGGDLTAVRQVLEDLATHPATARHMATKLVVHFVSDKPDKALVDHLASVWTNTGGALLAVYAALLDHPAAWSPGRANVKPPFDFVASALRAVDPPGLTQLGSRDVRRSVLAPLVQMGQKWLRPPGPDGWPEADSAWVTPQGQAARIRWAMAASARLGRNAPDPRQFAQVALGSDVDPAVSFAASAAESRAEGVGIILVSPAFQRR